MPAPRQNELIDLVDAVDRPVGQIKRGVVLEQEARFRVVHIFVFNPQGKLLLQRLGRNRERNPLRWGSSVAGYLNVGESYGDAAVRRLKEELGLADTPLIKYGSIAMQDRSSTKFITLCTTVASDPRIAEPDHIEALRFWSIPKLEQELQQKPERFTETFRYVYRFFQTTSALSV
jgi:isopentenyl-diphosphate Delta-isomerase